MKLQFNPQLAQAETVISTVGHFILNEWRGFKREKAETKGKNDLVSYVDRKAEQLLEDGLSELFPGADFILEEGGEKGKGNRYRWIIDPLDGTTNFIHGVPAFAVSVALQDNSQTIAAWVLDVANEKMYHARKNEGAYLNGNSIHVSEEAEFHKSLLATGFPYSKNTMPDSYLEVLRTFVKSTHGVRRFGAAALDLAWVASGIFEGFYEIGLKPWDVAAGALLVEEAGGKVTDFSGKENYVFGQKILASNGFIHPELLKVLQDYQELNLKT